MMKVGVMKYSIKGCDFIKEHKKYQNTPKQLHTSRLLLIVTKKSMQNERSANEKADDWLPAKWIRTR